MPSLAAAQLSLLGYPINRTAASQMLYGGIRLSYLSPQPFRLHIIKSEELPSVSLQREREDLSLEIQLPKDLERYNQLEINIQRQVGPNDPVCNHIDEASANRNEFNMREYFSNLFHPELHHNSSLPYRAHDTNNVFGLRLFPLNMGVRLRVEGVRIRTKDCLQRLKDAKFCAQFGEVLQYPLPYSRRAQLQEKCPVSCSSSSALSCNSHAKKRKVDPKYRFSKSFDHDLAYLRGGPSHPSPTKLSIFTRPQDFSLHNNTRPPLTSITSCREAALKYFCSCPRKDAQSWNCTSCVSLKWTPSQMMKPMAHSWSPAIRSSGTRGPTMQLMQERLDRRGFGWKRKSRSLWQQDIDTAGFRPHRYF